MTSLEKQRDEAEQSLNRCMRKLGDAVAARDELARERDDAIKLASAAIQALPKGDREEIVRVMKDRVS